MKTTVFRVKDGRSQSEFYDFDVDEMISTPNFMIVLNRRGQITAVPKEAKSLRIHIGSEFIFTKITNIGDIVLG